MDKSGSQHIASLPRVVGSGRRFRESHVPSRLALVMLYEIRELAEHQCRFYPIPFRVVPHGVCPVFRRVASPGGMTEVRRDPPGQRSANHDIFTQQCLRLQQLHFHSPCPLNDIGGADPPCVDRSSSGQRPSLRPLSILSSSFPRFLSGLLNLIDRQRPSFLYFCARKNAIDSYVILQARRLEMAAGVWSGAGENDRSIYQRENTIQKARFRR